MASKRKSKVWLEPEEHVYIHEDTEVKYKSVTTVLSMLEPHFDTKGVARAISLQLDENKKPEYIGMTQQEILDEWERINREANEYGTDPAVKKAIQKVQAFLAAQSKTGANRDWGGKGGSE